MFERRIDELLEGRRFGDLDLDLAVVATDVRACRPVVFERATTPEVKLSRAVRFSHWPRTVVIDSGQGSPLEFRLDRARKNDLYRRGYETTLSIVPMKFRPAGEDAVAS